MSLLRRSQTPNKWNHTALISTFNAADAAAGCGCGGDHSVKLLDLTQPMKWCCWHSPELARSRKGALGILETLAPHSADDDDPMIMVE